jgi:hypothetical protein
MVKMKKLISMLLVAVMVLGLSGSVFAEGGVVTQDTTDIHTYLDIMGASIASGNGITSIDDESDLNSVLEYVKISVADDSAMIETVVEGNVVTYSPQLYQNQLGYNAENMAYGIDENLSSNIQLVRFTIEKNATLYSLLTPNQYMIGETVVSLGFYSQSNSTTYTYQFIANELTSLNAVVSDADMVAYELANYGAQPVQSVKQDMESFDVTFESETQVESSDTESGIGISAFSAPIVDDNGEPIKSEESKLIDQYIEMSKEGPIDLNPRNRALVPNIPDYVYSNNVYGWEGYDPGYNSNGMEIGYVVYHMPMIDFGNVMNYVSRYEVSTNFNISSQQFIHSFTITHNLWIQYFGTTGQSIIFDDRPGNARLVYEIQALDIRSATPSGYFTHMDNTSRLSSSFVSRVVSVAVGWTSVLSNMYDTYLTLSTSQFATGTRHPLPLYSRSLNVQQNSLVHPYDHLTVMGYGRNISAVSCGHDFRVYAR